MNDVIKRLDIYIACCICVASISCVKIRIDNWRNIDHIIYASYNGSRVYGACVLVYPIVNHEDTFFAILFVSQNVPPIFGSPIFGPPIFGPPIVGPPIFGPPTFGPPIFGPPIFGPPIFGPPIFGPPIFGPPIFGPPIFGPPIFGPPTFGPPIFGPPIFGPPIFGPPIFGPPIFGPPIFGPPIFGCADSPPDWNYTATILSMHLILAAKIIIIHVRRAYRRA